MNGTNRRTFVKLAAAAAITPAVAGCTGNGDPSDGNGDDDGNGDGNDDGNGGDAPAAIDDYLSDANGYDGDVADHTGEDEVTIDVGTGDGGLGFSPAAIRIDAGTTVVWEWTGDGGGHDVTSADESDTEFQSDFQSDAGETFEQTFDEAGIQLYNCSPHVTQGMKGGIEVV